MTARASISGDLAPRSRSLDGLTLGLLDNSKHGSKVYLQRIAELLAERYALRGVVWSTKPEPTRPADKELLEAIIPQADVLVTAVGD